MVSLRLWLILYLETITLAGWALMSEREYVLRELSSEKATSDWNLWRADAESQSGQDDQPIVGPVQRRVPKSDELPLLILMRDYFIPASLFCMFGITGLFFFLAFVTQGMTRQTDRLEQRDDQ